MPHLQTILQAQVKQQLEDLMHHQVFQDKEQVHLMHQLVEAHLMHLDSNQNNSQVVQSVAVHLINQLKFSLHNFHHRTFSNLWMIKENGNAKAAAK